MYRSRASIFKSSDESFRGPWAMHGLSRPHKPPKGALWSCAPPSIVRPLHLEDPNNRDLPFVSSPLGIYLLVVAIQMPISLVGTQECMWMNPCCRGRYVTKLEHSIDTVLHLASHLLMENFARKLPCRSVMQHWCSFHEWGPLAFALCAWVRRALPLRTSVSTNSIQKRTRSSKALDMRYRRIPLECRKRLVRASTSQRQEIARKGNKLLVGGRLVGSVPIVEPNHM